MVIVVVTLVLMYVNPDPLSRCAGLITDGRSGAIGGAIGFTAVSGNQPMLETDQVGLVLYLSVTQADVITEDRCTSLSMGEPPPSRWVTPGLRVSASSDGRCGCLHLRSYLVRAIEVQDRLEVSPSLCSLECQPRSFPAVQTRPSSVWSGKCPSTQVRRRDIEPDLQTFSRVPTPPNNPRYRVYHHAGC
jgi:hypothetical protein